MEDHHAGRRQEAGGEEGSLMPVRQYTASGTGVVSGLSGALHVDDPDPDKVIMKVMDSLKFKTGMNFAVSTRRTENLPDNDPKVAYYDATFSRNNGREQSEVLISIW
jgi:hypothetical protein